MSICNGAELRAFHKLLPVLAFLLLPSGCSHIDDNLLNQEISDFSHSVAALSVVIQNEFGLAERINSIAFVNNLEFQLETGGNPDTTLRPLFSGTDLSARQTLLAALTGYAQTMEVVASGKAVAVTLPDFSSLVSSLNSLKTAQFNLSHSLSVEESDDLVSDMTLFEELFILPARDARLAVIVKKGTAVLQKAAMLLYLDIGTTTDQSAKCSYTVPANTSNQPLSSLKLCRGGLRSIAATAIRFDATTWKDRLLFEKKQAKVSLSKQTQGIKQLVGIQQTGSGLDRLYADTQAALVAMLAAHREISATLQSALNSNLSKSLILSKNTAFMQKVEALMKSSNRVTQTIEALTGPVLSSAVPTTSTGEKNDGN